MRSVSSSEIGKALLVIAAVIALVGVALLVGSRIGLGRLPGDLRFGRGNTRIYFPLATSLLISVVLTIVLNLFLRR
jgi:hypothetical protein